MSDTTTKQIGTPLDLSGMAKLLDMLPELREVQQHLIQDLQVHVVKRVSTVTVVYVRAEERGAGRGVMNVVRVLWIAVCVACVGAIGLIYIWVRNVMEWRRKSGHRDANQPHQSA